MGVEGIGYNDEGNKVDNELVDLNNQEEKEVVEAVNRCNDENNQLAEHALENLSDKQLAQFLSSTFLEGGANGGVKRYRECISSGNIKFLEFGLRAALQLVQKKTENKKKYTAQGEEAQDGDSNAKTIDERLMGENKDQGIKADGHIDETIVRVLQKVVGARVDGKPGPQTIVKTVLKLGGNVGKYYEQVNTIYKGNKELEIHDVGTFNSSLLDGPYCYDKLKISLYENEEGTAVYLKKDGEPKGTKINIDESSKKPSLQGYIFNDGWIYGEGTVVTAPQNVVPENVDVTNIVETLKSIQLPEGYTEFFNQGHGLYQFKDAEGNCTKSYIHVVNGKLQICNLDQDKNISFVLKGNKIEKISTLKPMDFYVTELKKDLKLDGFSNFELRYVQSNSRFFNLYNPDFDAGRDMYIYNILDSKGDIDSNKWNEIKQLYKKEKLPWKFAKDLRGRTFSYNDLFDDSTFDFSKHGIDPSKLREYFSCFDNDKVKISDEEYPSTSDHYTHVIDNGSKILVRLDDHGPDKTYHRDDKEYLKINVADIDDGNGGINEENLKNVMREMVIQCYYERYR